MWQYIFLTLRRRRSQSVLASGGFLLAACALILLSATTQTTALQANRIINQNWRPSYDLVVLPPAARTMQGTTIPADALEGYNGGISLQHMPKSRPCPELKSRLPWLFLAICSFLLRHFDLPLPLFRQAITA